MLENESDSCFPLDPSPPGHKRPYLPHTVKRLPLKTEGPVEIRQTFLMAI